MAIEPETDASPEGKSDDVNALRERVEALERERAEQAARTNAAIAAAQDRSYWLDRWGVDLNALMRRRGASELRAAFRALRALYRPTRSAARELRGLPLKLQLARARVDEERTTNVASDDEVRFRRTISPDRLGPSPVTDVLYDRLEADDVASVESRLEPPEAALLETAGPADRKRLTLAFAAHYMVRPALERSGLTAAMPPADVHSMARTPAAPSRSTYYADLVVDAFAQSGLTPRPGQAGLDFGCSSGRVVSVLAAAYPEIEWHGCDRLAAAIERARDNLPGIDFLHSPAHPPLPYDHGSFDLVFAISIWPHFGENAALAWLAEMGRVLRPGGRLVLTTHGPHSIAYASAHGLRPPAQLEEIQQALYRDGFWFVNELGSGGDFGLRDAEWGTAFVSPEWMLRRAGSAWRIGAFHPGRVQDNQDLYALEPR
jgi:SAM-dependent methyltransferase